MFSNAPRCRYRKNQLGEVICQLRFPEILTIETTLPDEFQEAIRAFFPQYSSRKEAAAPKLTGTPGNLKLEPQRQITNHQFLSEDRMWRVNLTSTFISLSCSKYTCWEDFARMLDQPLAAFIKIYRPAYFERVGLRYLNFISRKELDLQHLPFRALFQSQYLGLLEDEEVQETTAARSTVDAELAIRGGCRVKLHAGPGLVKRAAQDDKEVRFIFDQDLYMPGKVEVSYSAGALETLHTQADAIFRGAITDTLHAAMEPETI